MTVTLSRSHQSSVRAPRYAPHIKKGVAEILAKLMGYETAKAAQMCMDRVQRAMPQIATAFHLSNDPHGIATWAASFDNVRNHGTALPLSIAEIRSVARAERNQDEAREVYLGEQTREHLVALDRRLTFEIREKQELQLSVRAELGKVG